MQPDYENQQHPDKQSPANPTVTNQPPVAVTTTNLESNDNTGHADEAAKQQAYKKLHTARNLSMISVLIFLIFFITPIADIWIISGEPGTRELPVRPLFGFASLFVVISTIMYTLQKKTLQKYDIPKTFKMGIKDYFIGFFAQFASGIGGVMLVILSFMAFCNLIPCSVI